MKRLVALILCFALSLCLGTTSFAKTNLTVSNNFVLRDEKTTVDSTGTLYETLVFTENGIEGKLSSVWQEDGHRVITLEYDGKVQTFRSNILQPTMSANNGMLRVTYPYTSPWYYVGSETISGYFVSLTQAALAALLSSGLGAPLSVGLSIAASIFVSSATDNVSIEITYYRSWRVYMPNVDPWSHIFYTRITTDISYYANGSLLATKGPVTKTFQSTGGPYI